MFHDRWADGRFNKNDESALAHHKSTVAEANEATIEDLYPGLLYKIVVEAVVSVKDAVTNTKDPEMEKQNRRTTHVVSKPVFVRTRAPCEPPRPIVTGQLDFLTDLIFKREMI